MVRDGDLIDLDVEQERIDLLVEERELARRRRDRRTESVPDRGWSRLHALHVLQANLGADLDFL
jgi:dihydroxy-acid dehydratase